MDQKPTIGRVVRFSDNPGEKPMAAIVCDVIEGDGERVNLAVFDHFGNLRASQTSVPKAAEGGSGRSWHWPERT